MNEERLPLFPLQVVLFPQTALPLHIFEERYKALINECLEERREFGIERLALLHDHLVDLIPRLERAEEIERVIGCDGYL